MTVCKPLVLQSVNFAICKIVNFTDNSDQRRFVSGVVMGTQGTVLVSSALYGQNDDGSHGALLQNKYEVSLLSF